MADTYIGKLQEYALSVVDSFPQEHVDDATRDIARKLVVGMFANDAERAANQYTGFGSFGTALLKGEWDEAAFKADTQNAALLAYWVRLRYWLGQKATELAHGTTVGEDGVRYRP